MKKKIALLEQEVEYTLKTSDRVRRLRLTIHHDGRFVVTAHKAMSQNRIEQFIKTKSAWVVDKLEFFKKAPPKTIIAVGRNGFKRYKDSARLLVQERLLHFNTLYQFRFDTITIKNQKTRWGSCSKKGNLNFNYKIALLPNKLSDYIVVHELCHLAEFDHSQKFWEQVGRALPHWRELRSELKQTFVR